MTDSTASRHRLAGPLFAAALAAAWFAFGNPAHSAEPAFRIPPPAVDETPAQEPSGGLEKAVLAGGCFWGVQGVFQHVKGVENAVSGYAGGKASTAEYHAVGTGRTGHAEAVEITYDPSKITYGKLLQVYFSVAHNPTQLNYQGPDRGTQYRSTIFAGNGEQEKVASAYIAQLDQTGIYPGEIVTTLETGKAFYPAEAYHQDFLTENPTYPYIVYNDLPKVEALKTMFPNIYSETPVLVKSPKS